MTKAVYNGVDNVARKVKQLYVGENNVSRKVTTGYIGVDNVARQCLSSDTPISELSVGDSVYMNVNGTSTRFIVVQQGLPMNDYGVNTAYDTSCDGTWLLMKNIYATKDFNNSYENDYANSSIHSYLNGQFLDLFDKNIQNLIKEVKIPYIDGCGDEVTEISYGSLGLSTKIFLLSAREVGHYNYMFATLGYVLNYFEDGTGTIANNKRIASYIDDGTASTWITRTPSNQNNWQVVETQSDGGWKHFSSPYGRGIRPALILPHDTLVDSNLNVIG